jgi:hypothetical protein
MAQLLAKKQYPIHVAYATIAGKVIAWHFNNTSHHAEEHLITRLKRYWPNNTRIMIWVLRLDGEGNMANSKPCTHCCQLIRNSGVKKICYSMPGGIMMEDAKSINSEHLPYRQSHKHRYSDK